MIVKGTVTSGKHEARFFVLIPAYQRFFRSLLLSPPYPGTLNIILDKEIELNNRYTPDGYMTIRWDCLKRIQRVNVKAIAVIPGKKSGRILEIISTMKLRKLLELKNGQEVMLSVGGCDSEKRSGGSIRGKDVKV